MLIIRSQEEVVLMFLVLENGLSSIQDGTVEPYIPRWLPHSFHLLGICHNVLSVCTYPYTLAVFAVYRIAGKAGTVDSTMAI